MITIDNDILLRKLEINDASLIFNAINTERAYLGEWLPFVEDTKSVNDSEEFVRFSINNMNEKGENVYAVIYNGSFAGLIGFRSTDPENKTTEIGYWLSERFQKKGIIIRSCKALLDYAFNNWGMQEVRINAAVANNKSRNIPEKLGFEQEKIITDGELLSSGYTDIVVYVMKKECFR